MVAVGVKACEVVFCGGFFGADCVFVVFFGVVEEESCCGFGCELVGVFEGCFELLGVMGVGDECFGEVLRVVYEWVSDEVAEVVCVVFCGYFFSGGAQEVFA